MKRAVLLNFTLCALLVLGGCTKEKNDLLTNEIEDESLKVKFALSPAIHTVSTKSLTTSEMSDMPKKEIVGGMEIFIQDEEWPEKSYEELTKTTWGTTSSVTTWLSGDPVGIYMRRNNGVPDAAIDHNNAKYATTSAGDPVSLGPLEFPSLNYPATSTAVDFFSYYPYSWVPQSGETVTSPVVFANSAAVSNMNLNYAVQTNQTAPQGISNADLMFATPVRGLTNTSGTVALSYKHALTLVTFRIKSTNFSLITLTKVKLSGTKVTNSGTLNISATSPAVVANAVPTFQPYAIVNKALNSSTITYVDLIINPCTSTSVAGDMVATFTIGNCDYTCEVPAFSFIAGRRTYVDITINNTFHTGNVNIVVGKGGKVQIGETVITGEGIGNFDNINFPLVSTLTADAGWVPFKTVTNTGVSTALPTTSPQTYNIAQNSIPSYLKVFFRPTNWYDTNNLIIHYDSQFPGGYSHPYTNVSATDNYGYFNYNTWTDLAGNNYDGTLVSSNHNTSSGWNSNVLKLDGTNDVVSLPGVITSNFTMNFVLVVANAVQKADCRIVSDGASGNGYPSLMIAGASGANATADATRKLAMKDPSGTIVNFPGTTGTFYAPPRGQIIQLTITFDNVTKLMKLYVNGVYNSQLTFTGYTPASIATAGFGGLPSSAGRQFRGDFYSFMLYGRTFTDPEVLQMYNFNRTRFAMP